MRVRTEKTSQMTQIARNVYKLDTSFRALIVILSLSTGFQASASNLTCQSLFDDNASISTRKIMTDIEDELIAFQNDPAYEIHISGQELAADITEAMLANPGGFTHKDAEKAIIANIGDLSKEASDYLAQSKVWVDSNKLQESMTELQYATDDFISASKSFSRLNSPGTLQKIWDAIPFVGIKEQYKQRKLKDLVQALQASRHRAIVTRRNLNSVMTSFEKLNKDFAGHYTRLNNSIKVLQSAIDFIEQETMLPPDEQATAALVLQRYLSNVMSSISTSHQGLKALHMTFTNHDFVIKTREDELRTATELMLNAGISTDVLNRPFYVKEALDENPNVRPEITDIFYSGRTPDEVLKLLSYHAERIKNKTDQSYSIDEILLMLKLMPKGSKSLTSKWNFLFADLSNYTDDAGNKIFSNDGQPWVENTDSEPRSPDIQILFQLLAATTPSKIRSQGHQVERSEFGRYYDYIDDIMKASVSLNDGLNRNLKKKIDKYLKVLADAQFKAIDEVLKTEKESERSK